jgi:hypothetical protein
LITFDSMTIGEVWIHRCLLPIRRLTTKTHFIGTFSIFCFCKYICVRLDVWMNIR